MTLPMLALAFLEGLRACLKETQIAPALCKLRIVQYGACQKPPLAVGRQTGLRESGHIPTSRGVIPRYRNSKEARFSKEV